MPRATPVPDSEDTLTAPKRVRRAPRKKTLVSEEVSDGESVREVVPPPARRKAPVRRVAAPAATAAIYESPVASSATTTASVRPRRGGRFQVLLVIGVLIVGIGASAAIGLSDQGKIDVAARIQEQSQLQANQTGGEGGQAQMIPVQNTPVNIPNGGLVPAGAATPPPPPPAPEPATTTASSTDAAASTTAQSVNETSTDAPATDASTEAAGGAADAASTEPALVE